MNDIDTPALVVDENIALANIKAFQQHCDKAGLMLRPHIKTHKSVYFAKKQLDAGACGITCQKIGEAEAMARAGVHNILITFNIIGESKLARLRDLANKIEKLSVTADNAFVINGLAQAFEDSDSKLHVLVECDTGAKRCGVQTPDDAAELARTIHAQRGLVFGGLMTYPAPGGASDAAKFMQATREILTASGLSCPTLSTGGTPDMWQASTHSVFTEYRIGTYIFNDRSLVDRGTCTESDCAARVHATVVSRPTDDQVVIDAGSKVLTSDLLGMTGYGRVVGFPDSDIINLSEEHGVLSVPATCTLQPGDRIEVIPNHVCVVTNMFDRISLINIRGDVEDLAVDARGCVR